MTMTTEDIEPAIKMRAFKAMGKLRNALENKNISGLLIGDNEVAALLTYIEYLEDFDPIDEVE
jgi:hypothetical protein